MEVLMINEKLQLSKFVRIIERENDYAVYHSLYGGLCLIDSGILELLRAFEDPKLPSEYLNKNFRYSEEYIESFLKVFMPKHFLVSPECNEYALIEQKKRDRKNNLQTGWQLGVIQLVVTNLCNFRCEYCFTNLIYSSKERIESQRASDNKNMTPDLAQYYIEEVINTLKKSGRNSLHIQFFGGEPLVNWKVIKYVLEQFRNGAGYGIDITYSIVTNGSLITEEVADYFKKYNVPVVVSFDSPKGDDRVMANGQKSFDSIVNGLSLLKRFNNRVVFNSVLSKETFDYFDTDLIDFAICYNVSEIGVLFDLDPDFYSIKETVDIVNKLWQLYAYGKKKGVVVTGYWHMIFQQMAAYDYFKDRGFKTCSATGCQLSIEPSGKVFACKGSSGYFGNVQNMTELLASPNYEKYAMRAFRNAPECEDCEIENFCSGFCLGPLEKKYNDIYVIEENTCKVYKELTKRLIMDADKSEIEFYYTPAG
jgi:uncharacterized protein